jgi:hypothetical protein
VFRRLYTDSVLVRLSLETLDSVIDDLPAGTKLWVDPALDGLQDINGNPTNQYMDHVKRFEGYERISDPAFQASPAKNVVVDFVNAVMDACTRRSRKPQWTTIPQLPMVGDSSRNRINRELAKAAGQWKVHRSSSVKLILPIILTHQDQTRLKTKRKRPLSLAKSCYEAADADGVWVVEANMNDQGGSKPLDHRFAAIVDFHKEMADELSPDWITIAGPYWGLNLILWARNLVRYAAISLGSGYRYYVPGSPLHRANERFALPPLRRWAVADSQLRPWLKESIGRIPPQENSRRELETLYRNYDVLAADWRLQVAGFYKRWFDEIESVPRNGRALALFQQFSSAYVLGRSLPEFKGGGSARRPERVAQQLMMHCL